MSRPLDYDGLVRVLRAGAARVKAGADELGRLDSAIGDGDHGIAMSRAMEALEKGIDGCTERTAKALLQRGRLVRDEHRRRLDRPADGIAVDGHGGSRPATAAEIDAARLASMFEAGLAQLRTISQAQVGDKTMVDALVPAVEALRKAAAAGDSVADGLAEGSRGRPGRRRRHLPDPGQVRQGPKPGPAEPRSPGPRRNVDGHVLRGHGRGRGRMSVLGFQGSQEPGARSYELGVRRQELGVRTGGSISVGVSDVLLTLRVRLCGPASRGA